MWNLNRNIILVFIVLSHVGFSQTAWTWTPLADMPVSVANNAVAEGEIAGNKYVYSFGGIDSTKIWSGITKQCFRYDVSNDYWEEIDTLPIDLPVVAASANTVKNKIYIIGGYHVEQSGNEISSNEVFIFDPVTNAFETNGANTLIPIDDQAQVVYKDSLIYVITGWSNTGNTFFVQMYDPALDQWTQATSVPTSTDFRVFGSSAQIIGDTIFYYGGASMGANFPATKKLRKGIVDPVDPSQITWSVEDDAINTNYRSACVMHGDNVFWIGGSETSYNYDGIAYNGSGGVPPSTTIARYDAGTKMWYEGTGAPYGVMDLRGYGQITSTEWVICGGMEAGQAVSNKAFKLTYDPVTGQIQETEAPNFYVSGDQLIFDNEVESIRVISPDGRLMEEVQGKRIEMKAYGIYLLEFTYNGQTYRERFFLNSF